MPLKKLPCVDCWVILFPLSIMSRHAKLIYKRLSLYRIQFHAVFEAIILVCSCWHNVWYPILIETADIIYLTDRQFQWEKRVFFNCIFTSDLKAWLCFICGVAVIWAPVFTFSAKIQPKWRFRFLPRDLSDTEMWKESTFYVA